MENKSKHGVWKIEVDNETIRVENKATMAKLFINDKLQDVSFAIDSVHMTGKLNNGKQVKVVLGGGFKIHCYIFVDNECLLED